jgi:hypothetical protein
MMTISEQLDSLPGLPKRKPYIPGNIPWDKFDQWEIEDHIEIMGILREDIGTFRRLLERDDLLAETRDLVEKQIPLDEKCIEHCRALIRKIRDGK